MQPTELLAKLLTNATDLDVVNELVAEDATYVSLNYNNPDLTAIEPWCGTHSSAGPAAIHQTFVDVGTFWEVLGFDIYTIFSGVNTLPPSGAHGPEGSAKGTDVAAFGRFKYKSRTLGKISDSPFCVWARVDEEMGKVTYMQFMEDTLSSAASFAKEGRMVYISNPETRDEYVVEVESRSRQRDESGPRSGLEPENSQLSVQS